MNTDRTVPMLVSVGELEALAAAVAVMLAMLRGAHSSDPSENATNARARAVLEGLERHLAATLKAVPS